MVSHQARKKYNTTVAFSFISSSAILGVILLAAGCLSQGPTSQADVNNPEILLEIPGSTTVIAHGISSVSDMRAAGVLQPEQQSFTEFLKKFDLVTFNQTILNDQIRSGKRLPVRIREREYTINVTSIRNITSTRPDKALSTLIIGNLDGNTSTRVFLRVGKDETWGSFVLDNETINIVRYSEAISPVFHSVPSYFVYSSKDVYFDPKKGWLCGGGFEIHEMNENQTDEDDLIHLTEGDFVAVPEFRRILLGERREGCILWDLEDCPSMNVNGIMLEKDWCVEQRRKNPCIGDGRYDCQGGLILSYYRYFEYEGQSYRLVWTTIS